MATERLTTIPVHSNVVRQLRSLKTADQTWDDFLLDMAEDYTPPGWYAEMERRRQSGIDVDGADVIERSRQQTRRGD